MGQGLPTVTLPTQIGSDLAVLATSMALSVYRRVYPGVRVSSPATIVADDERADRYAVTVDVSCKKPEDGGVLTGEIDGRISKLAR